VAPFLVCWCSDCGDFGGGQDPGTPGCGARVPRKEFPSPVCTGWSPWNAFRSTREIFPLRAVGGFPGLVDHIPNKIGFPVLDYIKRLSTIEAWIRLLLPSLRTRTRSSFRLTSLTACAIFCWKCRELPKVSPIRLSGTNISSERLRLRRFSGVSGWARRRRSKFVTNCENAGWFIPDNRRQSPPHAPKTASRLPWRLPERPLRTLLSEGFSRASGRPCLPRSKTNNRCRGSRSGEWPLATDLRRAPSLPRLISRHVLRLRRSPTIQHAVRTWSCMDHSKALFKTALRSLCPWKQKVSSPRNAQRLERNWSQDPRERSVKSHCSRLGLPRTTSPGAYRSRGTSGIPRSPRPLGWHKKQACRQFGVLRPYIPWNRGDDGSHGKGRGALKVTVLVETNGIRWGLEAVWVCP